MKNNEGNQKENKLDTKGNVEINNNEVEIVSQNLQSTIDHITKNVAPIIEMQNRVEHIQEQIQGVFQPIIQRYNSINAALRTDMNLTAETFIESIKVSISEAIRTQEFADSLKGAFSINFELSGVYEAVRRISEKISESVQKITFPSISEERKRELIEIYELWGSYGWTINPCTNVAMIFSKKVDKKSADLIALKQCSGQKMKQIFKFISENKRVKKSDFEEAVFDYEHKQYKSCALILFSLIDAILIRLQKKSYLDGKRRKVGLYAVNETKKRTEIEVNTELFSIAMFYTNLFSCLTKVFEGGKDFKMQPDVINRNFLDHGMMTRKVRRKDCIQLFLLYYNMLELLELIY